MKEKAWIVALDMGYGHGRAAHPLVHLSPTGKVINANNYPGIPHKDYNHWNQIRFWYELISRLKRLPLVGSVIFGIMDNFQKIPTFHPGEKDGKPTVQLKQAYTAIRKGLGKHLIEELNKDPLPLICTFFSAAYMAEEHEYKGDIYLVICDSDVSRAWAPLFPDTSRIRYCVPTEHVAERLKTYGVREDKIFITGFPMPEENIGAKKEIVEHDLAARLINLDPKRVHEKEYKDLLTKKAPHHPLTITFAVGGAGAQKQIGLQIVKSLAPELEAGKARLNLIAGIRSDVRDWFAMNIQAFGLERLVGKSVFLHHFEDKQQYFSKFNELMRTTDVLWTKPSELVFYTSLGIPIIMAPAIGSQEDANQAWLESIGAGITQCDPDRTHEWLFEWLHSGVLAQTALHGYTNGNLDGVKNITKLLHKQKAA